MTRYGLDGPGIEFRWGRDFPYSSRTALGPTQPPVPWVPGLFPGVKRPELDIDHPLPFRAEVKKRVQLYLYSPSGPSWPVLRWTLPLHFTVLFKPINFTLKYTLKYFSEYLQVSCLTLFRLSSLIWLGHCNHCKLAGFSVLKIFNIFQQTIFYVDSVRIDLLAGVSNTRPVSQFVTALTLILFQVLNGSLLSADNFIYF